MASRVRAAALRYLKIRPRSVFELRTKLIDKGFSVDDVDEAITYLMTLDLINDRVFADGWIRYRLTRPFGFRRIINELKTKGVPANIIEDAVAQARGEYAEPDVVLEVAQRRAERLGNIDPQKKKKRLFDFLLRRGFAMPEVIKALKKI